MKYIYNDSTNPYYNLALEEYVLANLKDDDYVLIWQNDNTVVVGRHQNAMKEVNRQVAEEMNTRVVRRITGGGAVYHDMGNINFSYITDYDETHPVSYERFLEPVVKGLTSLGLSPCISGRNDLEIEGKKISGNAQTIIDNRFLHHGTLLYSSDLSLIFNVLNVSEEKIVSKSIESVRARVANITDFMDSPLSVYDFKKHLLHSFIQESHIEEVVLTQQQKKEIEALQINKYESWDWIYGESPKGNFHDSKRFSGGNIEVFMQIEKGIITECKIYGDFLALAPVDSLERSLTGLRYDKTEIQEELVHHDLAKHFGAISTEEILSCFI